MKNEDAHISALDIAPDTHLFTVFDGHGGSEVAKFCEAKFTNVLLENENFKSGNYEKALKETFLRMDQIMETPEGQMELQQVIGRDKNLDQNQLLSRADFAISNAGCTSNVLLVVGNNYYCANAGDARCLVYKRTGEHVFLSEDHKPDMEIEYKRIQKAGGYVVDGRVCENLNLTRAIGDLEYKRNSDLPPEEQIITANPDIVKREFTEEDNFFILGCDGIWELLTTEEICAYVEKNINDPEMPMTKLAESLLDKMIATETSEGVGCDNMSITIV